MSLLKRTGPLKVPERAAMNDPGMSPAAPEGHEAYGLVEPFDSLAMQALALISESVSQFLDEFTRRVAVEMGRGCSITMQRGGDAAPYTVASSDEQTVRLDELQYAQDDGPCLTATRTGVPVIVTDMATESRFGSYPAHAARVGARSSMSYPLAMATEHALAALNLYAGHPLDPPPELRQRAEGLARNAAGALDLAQRLTDQRELIGNLTTALESRSVIDQAIGVLVAQQRCHPSAAFDLLVTASQSRNIKLRVIASRIVTSAQGNRPGTDGARP
jgi:GAF domain-containing protein